MRTITFPDLPVDAGNISIADKDHYTPYGTRRGPSETMELKPGIYSVEYRIDGHWGEIKGKKILKVTSGQVWVGDAGYFVSDWHRYLDDTKFLEEMPEGTIAIDTGGDGSFTLHLKIRGFNHELLDPDAIFLDPSLRMENADGKPVFEMKRKMPAEGEMYYLFKIYEDNIPQELKAEFKKTFDNQILPLAANLGIPMYSFDEINERLAEKLKELGAEVPIHPEQIDVKIEIFDYSTKTLRNLIVGLSIQKMEENS